MLNIAKKIYTGWAPSTVLSEAEIVPDGESSNEKKKIAKLTTKYANAKELDNIPLPGFTLLKAGRKSWSSNETTWSVIDPRGFLVKISSKNLEDILHVTGITEGLIQQRCVWAREDTKTQMTLVPVSADNYNLAVKNTKLLDDKVKISEVQIGDTVSLQNGLTGRYMGSLSAYGRISQSSIGGKTANYKPGARLRKQIIEIRSGIYYIQTDAKILSIIDKTSTPMTKEESSEIINKQIESNSAYFTSSSYIPAQVTLVQSITPYIGDIKFVSASAVPKPAMTASEVSKADVVKYFDKFAKEKDPSIVFEKNGEYYIIDHPYWGNLASPMNFNVEEPLINFDPLNVGDTLYGKISTFGYNQTKRTQTIDNFTKFYIITKHVKSNTYI